jgi:hypothetical protein
VSKTQGRFAWKRAKFSPIGDEGDQSMEMAKTTDEDFSLGIKLKDQARKSLKDTAVYLDAANHFDRAGTQSLEAAGQPELDPRLKLVAEIHGNYCLYEKFCCLASFHYENKEPALAVKEHKVGIEHLTHAIEMAKSAISQVPAKIAAQLARDTKQYKFHRDVANLATMSAHSRDALQRDDLIGALDYYRRIIKHAESVVEVAYNMEPAYERIARGNHYGALANAHQASALILAKQLGEMDDNTNLGTISQDAGDDYFLHMLKALRAGNAAFRANPEWLQYTELNKTLLSQIRDHLSLNKAAWSHFLYLTANDPELVTMMKRLDMAHFKKTTAAQVDRAIHDNAAVRLWVSGSFYVFATVAIGLIVFVIITGATYWWQALLGLGTLETVLTLVIASTLRTVDKLNEARFMDLMKLAVNQQFKLFQSFLQTAKGVVPRNQKSKEPQAATKSIDNSK